MNWNIGLRVWFLVAIASLAFAYMFAGRTSALPRLWRDIGIALIGLVGISGAIGLGARTGVIAGVVLLVAAVTESVGLWIGMGRHEVDPGRKILLVGGTLCVLFASLRVLGGAARAATLTQAANLGDLLGEGVLNPLLIFLGALALGIGGRVSVSAERRTA